jgi:hypothetical protein
MLFPAQGDAGDAGSSSGGGAGVEEEEGKKTPFWRQFIANGSFYQDRLGTNTGAALEKESGIFL